MDSENQSTEDNITIFDPIRESQVEEAKSVPELMEDEGEIERRPPSLSRPIAYREA